MQNRWGFFLALLFSLSLCGATESYAQKDKKALELQLDEFFSNFPTSYTTEKDRCRLEAVKTDKDSRTIEIFANEMFAGQSFSIEKVNGIYQQIRNLLPPLYQEYQIIVYGKGIPIEELVTDICSDTGATRKKWEKARLYRGAPWVERLHRPYTVDKGLQGRHLSVWASHGRYYKNDKKEWTWQRPYLYCTTEDLFTQTIVVPFLIPMLENAGACVFSPRERDWQAHEAVVDNDTPEQDGGYRELAGRFEWKYGGLGFSPCKQFYHDGENPFAHGTSRRIHAVSKKNQESRIRWTPDIPESGRYAVYVSYTTLPASIPDARYTVRHRGVNTTFRVNQQMGGSTWVYLGTFDFAAGHQEDNFVELSNFSNHRGTVTADAVRFGSGMGNIVRGDSLQETASGFPRYLEGARYNAQWSGMPYTVYSSKQGMNDYGDDINVRSLMTNYLAGGSVYLPADSGLHVPIEMSVALHSDAGIAPANGLIGTLGIYTTGGRDGMLPAGLSRLTSRDLCDIVMSQVDRDLSQTYGTWRRRQMLDRNYSETREPQVPSMILEMLSHQNFRDMTWGHDPAFKFTLARAIYKGILEYSSCQHGTEGVVQPLPVTCFQTQINEKSKEIILSWMPQDDPLEASAHPDGFIVYTRQGDGGYDNGTFTRSPHWTLKAEENTIYSFRVTAVNRGGESFPSEELSAMVAKKSQASVLIIDGFQRVAGPQPVLTDSTCGFDMRMDPGVPYLRSPGFCGQQTTFNTVKNPKDTWGSSGNELEEKLIAGNTFDHSRLHGDAIATAGNISFASVSRAAIEAQAVDLNAYNIVDLILGLQKNDRYSSHPYPTLSPTLCNTLREFTRMRGSLLVSGAYVGRDQRDKESLDFLRSTLKVDAYAPLTLGAYTQAVGMNTSLHLLTELNETHYAVTHADCLIPVAPAFTTLLYSPGNYSAAIAYQGEDYRVVTMGFPFECIKYASDRDKIMNAFLRFLLDR